MNKKVFFTIVCVVAILVLCGFVGYPKYIAYSAEKVVNALYQDENTLAEIDQSKLDDAKGKVEKIKGERKELEEKVSTAQKMFDLKTLVNQMYKDGVPVDEIKKEDVDKVNQLREELKSKEAFVKQIDKQFSDAKTQVEVVDAANALFSDGSARTTLNQGVTVEQIDGVLNKVNTLKNETVKKNLTDSLNNAKNSLVQAQQTAVAQSADGSSYDGSGYSDYESSYYSDSYNGGGDYSGGYSGSGYDSGYTPWKDSLTIGGSTWNGESIDPGTTQDLSQNIWLD